MLKMIYTISCRKENAGAYILCVLCAYHYKIKEQLGKRCPGNTLGRPPTNLYVSKHYRGKRGGKWVQSEAVWLVTPPCLCVVQRIVGSPWLLICVRVRKRKRKANNVCVYVHAYPRTCEKWERRCMREGEEQREYVCGWASVDLKARGRTGPTLQATDHRFRWIILFIREKGSCQPRYDSAGYTVLYVCPLVYLSLASMLAAAPY